MTFQFLLFAHFLADFALQSDFLAEKKKDNIGFLLLHGLIYAAILALAFWVLTYQENVWLSYGIVVISHLLIDFIRVFVEKLIITPRCSFYSFLIDQALHISVLLSMIMRFDLDIYDATCFTTLANLCPMDKIIPYALLFLILMDPASVFVKKLTIYATSKTTSSNQQNSSHTDLHIDSTKEDTTPPNTDITHHPSDIPHTEHPTNKSKRINISIRFFGSSSTTSKKHSSDNSASHTNQDVANIGRTIGKLERIIIAFLVIHNAIEATGFVLAAKTIARHKKFDEDPEFGEKYLIGTLASTVIAIVFPYILKLCV